jgi:hypothetical protein
MSDTDKPESPKPGADATGGSVDPIIGNAVGSRLKSLFSEFAEEQVPDHLLDLLGQLEANEKAAESDGTTESENDPGQGPDRTGA